MKKRILVIGLLFLIVINVIGCVGNKATKDKPSEEELARAQTVCGVVRSVDKENIRIQLCGNLFWSHVGDTYMEVDNEYDSFKENDSVRIYYTGDMRSEKKDEYVEVYNIEVCYIEPYENDGKFTANVSLGGSEVSDGATRFENERILVPVEGEIEGNFRVVLGITDLTTNITTKTDIIYDVEDVDAEVTVTYDLDTMEVISITQ